MDIDHPYIIHPIASLEGHTDRAWHLSWNPTKPLLASCSADKSVRLYSYSGNTSKDLKFEPNTTIDTGHAKTVRGVAWSPSGVTLATASFDANIGIWEREEEGGDWECASLLEGHETECKSVAYSSSGTLLASCSRDKTVWIWEVHPDADFECLAVLMDHTQDVKSLAWHPSREILASASYDDTIKLYIDDPDDDWYCFATLTGHTSTVWSVAFAPGGGYLASGSEDCTVRIWKEVKENEWLCVLVLEGHERSVYSVSWGPGSSTDSSNLGWIASTGGDGKINIWELTELSSSDNAAAASPTPPKQTLIASIPQAHGVSDVNSVVWCPRKGYEDVFASVGDDGGVNVWRVGNSKV